MNEISFEGSITTYINFSKVYTFNLGDGLILTFPLIVGGDIHKTFHLEGTVNNDYANKYKIKQKLINFFSKLAFFFQVPMDDFKISNTSIKSKNTGIVSSEVQIYSIGAIVMDDIKISEFTNFNKNQQYLDIFELYRKLISEDTVTTFWLIYSVLLILIGNRFQIDTYLKQKFPHLKILHNDHQTTRYPDGEDNTLITAIRDTFSHNNVTFSGEQLNTELEIKSNIYNFRKIAYDVIKEKCEITN